MLTQEERDKVRAWLDGSSMSRPKLFTIIPKMLDEINRFEAEKQGTRWDDNPCETHSDVVMRGYCPVCLIHEVEALRAIVEKLDRTQDGVPVMRSDTVYAIELDGSISEGRLGWWSYKGGTAQLLMFGGHHNECGVFMDYQHGATACYSTRVAAEAAREKEEQP